MGNKRGLSEMKLWIDDIRNAPSEDWTVARTVTEAIRAISKFEFEEISIDHDISHQVAVGKLSRPYPCEECFCAVAYYIGEKMGNWVGKEPKIILHTSNPVGAKEMYQILIDHGIGSEIKSTGRIANRLEMEV